MVKKLTTQQHPEKCYCAGCTVNHIKHIIDAFADANDADIIDAVGQILWNYKNK